MAVFVAVWVAVGVAINVEVLVAVGVGVVGAFFEGVVPTAVGVGVACVQLMLLRKRSRLNALYEIFPFC